MELKFKINHQVLSMDTMTVVSHSKSFLSVKFEFLQSSEWEGMEKFAHFELAGQTFDVPLEGNTIPKSYGINLTAGRWYIYLHGDRYENGELKERVVTERCSFMVYSSGQKGETPFPAFKVDVNTKILAEMEQFREDLTKGRLNGKDGERGLQGETGPQGEQGLPGKDSVQINDREFTAENPLSGRFVANHFSNALKRGVSGEAIAVDDVSPVEHEVKCKISSVPDLSKVTVNRYGKNLFDFKTAPVVNAYYSSMLAPSGINYITFCRVLKGKTYTVSKKLSTRFKIFFTDEISDTAATYQGVGDASATSATLTNVDGHDYLGIYFALTVVGDNPEEIIKTIQVEYGSTATTYEKCKVQTYTPTAYGEVQDMTSLSPDMTILSNTPGVIINAEYNQDGNAVIRKLSDRIAEFESKAANI